MKANKNLTFFQLYEKATFVSAIPLTAKSVLYRHKSKPYNGFQKLELAGVSDKDTVVVQSMAELPSKICRTHAAMGGSSKGSGSSSSKNK